MLILGVVTGFLDNPPMRSGGVKILKCSPWDWYFSQLEDKTEDSKTVSGGGLQETEATKCTRVRLRCLIILFFLVYCPALPTTSVRENVEINFFLLR